MFHATFKTSFLNYKHRTTDFIAPEANDVKEVIKYLYTDEFRDFSINIFINFLNLIVFEDNKYIEALKSFILWNCFQTQECRYQII